MNPNLYDRTYDVTLKSDSSKGTDFLGTEIDLSLSLETRLKISPTSNVLWSTRPERVEKTGDNENLDVKVDA